MRMNVICYFKLGLDGSASSARVDWSRPASKQRQGFSFSTIYSVVTISHAALGEKKRNTLTHVSGTNNIFSSLFLLYEINIAVVFTQVTAPHISGIKVLASEG